MEIRPQPGPQEAFLASPADVCITGGGAGGGKTYGLKLEPMRHLPNGDFGAVIFRRTYAQITNEGGLWDSSMNLYPLLGGVPNQSEHLWTFPSGMTVSFAHMQYAKDRFSWDGSQVPLVGFDQLEGFEESQFWYMFSRTRSATAGVPPYIRATCNPVPESDKVGGWLHKLLQWWIDPQTGLAIPERSGVIRWFARINDEMFWADTRQELVDKHGPTCLPKSLTFIPSKLSDNVILEAKDPGYRAALMALPRVERERLLGCNWNVIATAGTVFDRAWFSSVLKAWPTDVVRWVRYWDKAGSLGSGCYTAGVLVGKRANGRFVIADIVRGQWSALGREEVIKQTAAADSIRCGARVTIWQEQEPGSGGKESAEATVRNLAGYTIRSERPTGDKVTRAGPLSAQAEAGNIDLVEAAWNEAWLVEAHNFDGVHGFADQVDAAAGGLNKVALAIEAAWA
jgi:predicted phage terminase large subunit-like protein